MHWIYMLAAIFWIIFGALTGWIICILRGNGFRHLGAYILAGMIGGVVGGFGGNLIGSQAADYGTDTTSMLFANFGAVILVVIADRAQDSS
jgi:uncharacterized membrane protein YeaQ/YmgE (transglycosylase-associated protein family)